MLLVAIAGFQLVAAVRKVADAPVTIIDFADPKAPMRRKLKAMQDPDYKRLWPMDCTGQNLLGHKVFSESVDGFKCLKSDNDKVAQPIAPEWYEQNVNKGNICCKEKCEDSLYSDCSPLDLRGAALKIIDTVREITVGNETIDIWHSDDVPPVDMAAGVTKQIALHISETVVSFVESEPTLTEEGAKNLEEIMGQLAALSSMIMTATATETKGSTLLACPHGSSTACLMEAHGKGKPCIPIGKRIIKLPLERAGVIAGEVGKSIEGVKVGAHFGHYKYEDYSGFPGGRYGAVILKAYDDSIDAPPVCRSEDLYKFVEMEDDGGDDEASSSVCCRCSDHGYFSCSRSGGCTACKDKWGGVEESKPAPKWTDCGKYADSTKKSTRHQQTQMHKSCKRAFG